MSDPAVKNIRDLRRQHNQELIRRMRNGESLTSFDSKASWYPPRPIIEKDKEAIERLYQGGKQREAGDSMAQGKLSDHAIKVVRRTYDEAG